MAEEVKCPECDERVELTAALRKNGLSCPTCGAALGKLIALAPKPDAAKAAPKPTRRTRRDDDDDYDPDHPRPHARARQQGNGNAGVLGGLILTVVLVVGGGLAAVYFIRGNRAKPPAPNAPGLQANPAPGVRPPPAVGWAGPTDTVAAETALPAVEPPFAVDPRLEADARPVYLADMQEFAVRMSPWTFGKGELGDGARTPIRVGGTPAPKGLSVHPNTQFATRAAYALGGKAGTLVGAAALNDYASEAWSPVVFVLAGDGRELWRSGPVNRASGPAAFRVDVTGVKVLELRAIGLGGHIGAHAVWVDPRIER